MHEPTEKLKEAFERVRAEDALKEKTSTYVAGQLASRRKSAWKRNLRMAAAAACLLLVFFAGYGSHVYFDTVSVISIDINPSVELGINAFDRVISVQAFNSDGDALAQSLQLRFLTSEEAVTRIMDSETVRTLLNQDEFLSITVVGENAEESESLCARLEQSTADQANTHCYSAVAQDVAQAHSCGLSYGKYRAYQQAIQQGEDLTLEEVESMTMKEIQDLVETHCGTETQPGTSETASSCGNGQSEHSDQNGHDQHSGQGEKHHK